MEAIWHREFFAWSCNVGYSANAQEKEYGI